MATIKVFDVNGVKEISCFDTLTAVPYLLDDSMSEDDFEDADDGELLVGTPIE